MRSGCCWPLAAPSPLALLLPLDANDSISVCKHTDEAGFDCAARLRLRLRARRRCEEDDAEEEDADARLCVCFARCAAA